MSFPFADFGIAEEALEEDVGQSGRSFERAGEVIVSEVGFEEAMYFLPAIAGIN